VPTPPAALVTRQPVYDADGEVFAYELLAAGGAEGAGDRRASARAIVQGVLGGVLDGLTSGGRLVVAVPADLLTGDLGPLLPAASVAVKVGPDADPADATLVATLADLRRRGALVVLSAFVPGDPRMDLLGHADLVGVDLSGGRHEGPLPRRSHAAGLPLLAEGIDSGPAFDVARDLGCRYFQGAVFVGSAIVAGGSPPGFRPVHLAMLEAVSRPEIDVVHLERVVKQDVQLTHAFLRYVNSASFGWRRRIDSLRHAFVLLGERQVRSWATLVVLADLAADRPQQLAVTAGVRARFCELLGDDVGVDAAPLELFTLGMFSLIDVLVGRPLREALAELPLSAAVQEALLGGVNPLRRVLDVVIAYESGEWALLGEALDGLGAGDERLLEHYLTAVDWAARTFDRSIAREEPVTA
jgi:c-di-GMP-related signal transduction protein